MARLPETRRAFWADVVSQAPDQLDGWVEKVTSRRWLGLLIKLAAVIGVSGAVIAGAAGLGWWWIPALVALLALAVFHEITYALWRGQQQKGGVAVGGSVVISTTTPDEGSGRFLLRTDAMPGQPTRQLTVPEQGEKPQAILFQMPKHGDYIREADLPMRVNWRSRLNRRSIEVLAFIPGGIVTDDTLAGSTPIEVYFYFADTP